VNDTTLLLIALGLVVLAGFFAASDSAISTVSPARAGELARERVRGARALQQIASDAPRYTNLLLLLRLLCELTATTLVALVFITGVESGWLAVLAAAGTMTVVSFVVVGVGPRTVGRQHAYAVGRVAAPPVLWLGRALGPLASLLIRIGNAFTPGKGFRYGPFATQVELRELVDLAEQRGVVEHDERDMIHSVFALGDTIAREVMVPRTEMVVIEKGKSAAQALNLALRSGFSRLPVIGESIDDVLGVVYLKDLVQRAQAASAERGPAREAQSGSSELTVGEVMRPATYVPESKHVDELLKEMQAARTHMAIVVDEYGGTAGLVTIEDILEEIVGEITDEYDIERPPVQRIDADTVRVSARLPVEDLGELFGVELETDDVETVAGLLAQALGRVPIPGAAATVDDLRLEAEGTTGRRNRIDTVLVTRHDAGDDAPRAGQTPERQTADA
jgi:CBS domain containing-hemolysin-like protein